VEFEYDEEDCAPSATKDDLQRLRDLADKQIAAQEAVDLAKGRLASCEKALRDIEEREIPDLMREVGITEFQLSDGMKISLEDKLFASVSAENKAAAYAWFEANGYERLVKRTYQIPFGRDEAEECAKIEAVLAEMEFDFRKELKVEPATVKSVIKKRLEAGQEVPDALFKVHRVQKSKLAVVKKGKGK